MQHCLPTAHGIRRRTIRELSSRSRWPAPPRRLTTRACCARVRTSLRADRRGSAARRRTDVRKALLMRPRTRETGFSLIEVLVVIVILTIGIFSVVRLFPTGFSINKQTESRTLAARLASQETNRFAATTAGLMDAILPTVVVANANSPTGYYIRVDLDTTPDDLSTPASVAPGVDPHYVSGINRIRWIRGETVRIPNPSPLGGGLRGSVYVLSSGPVYDYPGIDG
ncbi:MAG: prepilin-type N-terminal cleavage/methylation domain-containing protein, partial [Armatimonadetes bacterium]|nr:prepilin-type N-terminal cleavage/methylation domain-containing protein [Armatimonadota bacterium]